MVAKSSLNFFRIARRTSRFPLVLERLDIEREFSTLPAMSAGYSGTPLIKKLGIKAGLKLYFAGAPANLSTLLGELPPEAVFKRRMVAPLDYVHLFETKRASLEPRFLKAQACLKPGGLLWVSWPKGGAKAKLATDLNENLIREVGLSAGMVDIKVCAVDEIWSGLRFAFRRAD